MLTTDVVNFEQQLPDFNFQDMVTYITRVRDRVVKLKQNYQEKSSVITFLRPGTPDQREMGIVVHYCKLDKSTFCKVDKPPLP